MADTTIADVLKEFANNVTTSKVTERTRILGNVSARVAQPGFSESNLKGVLKYLVFTLGRYSDNKSRHAAEQVVRQISISYPKACVEYIVPALSGITKFIQGSTNPCPSVSGIALCALSWCSTVVQYGLKTEDSLQSSKFIKLVETQAILLSGALAADKKVLNQASYKRMAKIWNQIPQSVDVYAKVCSELEANVHNFAMISNIIKYYASKKQNEKISLYKMQYLEQYTKTILGSRVKLSPFVFRNCEGLLKYVTHEEFSGSILPPVQKAMLRNPEIILEAVGYLLASLSIDLSQYAEELCKPLATQLHSNDDVTRKEAASAFRSLAKQCSDGGAIEKVVKHMFKVLNGSEGKLSVTTQRIDMLTGIGNMSCNAVAGTQAVAGLSGEVVELFIPLLQQEVHEGTLVHALSVLQLWCSKFNNKVPCKLTQWFKAGIGQKSSTAVVRNAYIQCMISSYAGDTLLQAVDLIPILLQAIEKAKNQPTQVQLVNEAVSAACLCIKLSSADVSTESKLASFWSVMMDMNLQLFSNEKYVNSATESALITLVTLVERLLLDHPQRLNDKNTGLFCRPLIYALTHGTWNLRKHSQSSVKKILSSLGGSKLSLTLLKAYAEFLVTQKLVNMDNLTETELEQVIPPRVFVQSLLTICTILNPDPREAGQIAEESLIIAHHPCITQGNPDTWTDTLVGLNLDASSFITSRVNSIVKLFTEEKSLSQSHLSAVSTLVRVAPDVMLPPLIAHVHHVLSSPEICVVTHEEKNIMSWPVGELYDTSVLKTGEVEDDHNVKKQGKLYTYAEQLVDVELEKEKVAKLRAQGKETLTKKQQEAKELQLQKEAKTREQVQQLYGQVNLACTLIQACVEGNPTAIRLHLLQLLRLLTPLLATPLAAPNVSENLLQLGQATFEDDWKHFGILMAHVIFRILEPECDLNPEWCKEPLKDQIIRSVSLLHSTTAADQPRCHPFSATKFSYCYHLLRHVLKTKTSDKAVLQALAIILSHTELRSSKSLVVDENGPELLPRVEMLQSLSTIIGTNTGKVQQVACKGLVSICLAASGLEGCASADYQEVEILLKGLQSPVIALREASLQGLTALQLVVPTPDRDYERGLDLVRRIWVAKYDVDEGNRKLADKLWSDLNLSASSELCFLLTEDIIYHEEVVRTAAAEALAQILEQDKSSVPVVLEQLMEKYQEKLYLPPPIMDTFGRMVSEQPPDEWPARQGIAKAVCKLSPLLDDGHVKTLFSFLVPDALGDRSPEVRKYMLEAAVAAVNDHGKKNVTMLLPLFEEFLSQAPDSASFDIVRQSVVILMGSLAKHLEKEDPKVKPIVAKLIETLSTPSQQVQEAVANCLPPLVPAIKQDAPGLVRKLLQLLLESDSYGERKGAAYGLAGMIKGLGILALKQQDVMTTLTEAIQNKKNPRYREGALFAFEMLCTMLGRLFEPYVVHILPHLLLCFGDGNQYVREAADETAKAVMSKLSSHGVKLVLPSLLAALEEEQWRTKSGSVELLGAMAYCAPKQLSACLPSIVPKLTEVLTDSHVKVQKAGAQALKQIGSVIRNPEIQAIVPILLDALQDPTRKTTPCLVTLLETKFVHFVDAPSLALIMPVVERALKDRSTETRKMASQIIGNMYSLTDQKDLAPYLPSVMPGLKQSLLDPVPEVRNVSAHALGAMVKGMGEGIFEDLLPWLMQTLASENSSVDRSGAAQGLSEIVGGLGLEKLDKLMPDIIQAAERSDIAPHVRDGYIMMYIYLPSVFGDAFVKYVGPILPSVLKALADESEFVRDTALRAGQRIVSMYADTAIMLLLPELEKGLFDDNWRIRYSSIQLLGDLLYRISGVTGKMTTESSGEDDNFGTESAQQAILRTLGLERRNCVLAGLYMGRSDVALMVRQAALHVWKVVVTNTPKMLRDILSTLFTLLLGCLASTSYDKRQVAARTLGDVVKKLGERVLPEIIPILERGLDSDQSDQRQGVCIGLSEIMGSTSKEHIQGYADSLIPTVKKALCDPLPQVREAAARTFDNLHTNIGSRALDDILPVLLKHLDDEDMSEYALDGLTQVMAVKSRVILPYLVPHLTSSPVNTKALSLLASVADEALNRHLNKILPALLEALKEKLDSPDEGQELTYCQTVVLSVTDDLGVRTVMDELLQAIHSPDSGIKTAAVLLLHSYCNHTKTDLTDYLQSLFRGLTHLLTASENRVLLASWDCLDALVKKLDAAEKLQHIANMRQAMKFAVSDYKGEIPLPGLSLPKKGISGILPIYREGLLNGPPELKESASLGLSEIIRVASPEALKSSVVTITGPLIRILGDRYSWNVKVATLETLGLLLGKCGVMLKPFLPQLQTTFLKALNDTHRTVRLRSGEALEKLVIIHAKVDPLFNDLLNGAKSAEESSVRDTYLQGLRGCVTNAGAKLSNSVRKSITSSLLSFLPVGDDSTRMTAAGCLGALCCCLPEEELAEVMINQMLDASDRDWLLCHSRAVALSIVLKEASERVMTPQWKSNIMDALNKYSSSDRIPICIAGFKGIGYYLQHEVTHGGEMELALLSIIAKGINKHDSNDVKSTCSLIITMLVKCTDTPISSLVFRTLVPALVNGTKEKNTVVKVNSELALIALLHLRRGEGVLQTCLGALEPGMKDSLNEVVNKSLKKVASQPEPKDDELDDTVLK